MFSAECIECGVCIIFLYLPLHLSLKHISWVWLARHFCFIEVVEWSKRCKLKSYSFNNDNMIPWWSLSGSSFFRQSPSSKVRAQAKEMQVVLRCCVKFSLFMYPNCQNLVSCLRTSKQSCSHWKNHFAPAKAIVFYGNCNVAKPLGSVKQCVVNHSDLGAWDRS